MGNSGRSTAKDYMQTQTVTTRVNSKKEPREEYIWSRVWKERLYDADKKRVMLIGDSIIEGYSFFVAEQLKQDYIVSRWTHSLAIDSKFVLPLMEFALLSDEKIKYDVIHFTHGGHGKWTTHEDYEAALDKTIKRLVEICPESKIIIATPTEYCLPMLECQPVVDLEATELLSRRGEIAKKIAAKYNLTVNDMMQVSKANRYLHSDDGVHFTDEGYEVLAKSVAAAIKNV
ncbi:MAG: SGNH/GDSL hydrolase family protein [Ruminococcaceae bacterium]|nr:SGNH/GDSL hydrolase family protein [Oscillospiraceae bacterium]